MKAIKSGMSITSVSGAFMQFLSTRKKSCFFLGIIRRISPKRKKLYLIKKIPIGQIILVMGTSHFFSFTVLK